MVRSGRFAAGDHVHVTSIGKGIVRDVRNGGRYLVDVKGRHMVAGEAQLTPLDERSQRGVARVAEEASSTAMPTRSHAAAAIDLHGMTTDEAVAALDTFLNEALLAGLPEVRVIHGRSGGRLKAAVHSRLRVVTSIRSFHVDRSNQGVTVITL